MFLVLLATIFAVAAAADELTFDSQQGWSEGWQIPVGLIEINTQGQLRPREFRRDINAAVGAEDFLHVTKKRGDVFGGIWQAGSSGVTAPALIDGDPETFWQPESDADLVDWFVDIDLGRPVLARLIRLTFPDTPGQRPFRQFTVFVASGARIHATDDIYSYERVFTTTLPNSATQVEIPLDYETAADTTFVVDEGQSVDLAAKSQFRVVQFVRIVVDEKHDEAALSEVEVMAEGENVGLGTLG